MPQLVPSKSHQDLVHCGDVLEGRYRLKRVIGEGGMGTVFLAEHVLIQRRVAIKVLHSDLARDAEVVERFMNEARAAGTLGHPNIVESTDMGFARGDVPYIVFEYLEGSMLSDEVYRLGGLSPRRALKIAHQVASALQAAHRAGIVHRDLKTDNIFLTDKEDSLDHVKVLDFGISRFLEASDLTGRGGRRAQIMGTPEFLAPEQITTPDDVDARTDIYALGVVLYETLAARTPFVNEKPDDPHELLHRILLEPVPPLQRTDLPPGLADMITKLLAKNPDARYQTMGDVLAALDGLIALVRRDSLTSISQPMLPVVSEVPPLAPALPPVPKRRRSWLALIPAVLAGAAGGALWFTAAPTTTRGEPDVAAVQRDADLMSTTLDGVVTAAQLRAEGIATSPMLRAAIETDSATLADMARDGSVFDPRPGEVLEIFQHRDSGPASLLRMPASAVALPAAGNEPQLASAGQLRVIVTAPIKRQNATIGGTLALAVPLDVPALAPRIAEHAVSAKLVGGNGVNIALAQQGGDGLEWAQPVRAKISGLSLVAVVGTPVTTVPPNLVPAYACFGAASLFLLLFVVGLVTRR